MTLAFIKMKKNIILFLFIGILVKTYSQEYLTQKEAINDIDFFFNQAELIHPNLYCNISKDDLGKNILEEKEKIKDSISIDDFSRKMTVLANLIGDGHTNTSLSENLRNKYFKEKSQLPFEIRITDNKIFVKNSKSSKLKSEDNILSINNIQTSELFNLKQLVIGDIQNQKTKKLEKYFSYYLFMGFGFTDSLSITLRRNGDVQHTSVKLFRKKETVKREKYMFNFISDSVGFLTINSFSGIKKEQYMLFLDSVFNDLKMKNINNLVIDLRNNGGGNSYYAELIFPYLNISKYRFSNKVIIKTSKPEKKFMRKRFVKWYLYPLYPFAGFSKMGRILFFKKNGTITEIKSKDSYLKPIEKSFNGKIMVLTSNRTYSAAADFVVAFKYAERGLIVGNTLGQPYTGYIDKILVTLPNSKLHGGVSFKKYEYIGANKVNYNQGIEPDINIDFEKFKEEKDLNIKLTEIITNSNKKYRAFKR